MAKLILVRHGESIWNKKNLFTGWVDVPLDEKGIKDAKKVGRVLAKSKMNIKTIFTSELERAQETLYYILLEIKPKAVPIYHSENKKIEQRAKHAKLPELPIYKAVELNERNYGDLQGRNKETIKKKFGKKLFALWRRSYKTRPPHGESLEDTLKRALPYYKKKILPHLKSEKNVLIVAHGNSLRAITKHLEDISDEEIMKVEFLFDKAIVYEFDKKMKIKSKKVL